MVFVWMRLLAFVKWKSNKKPVYVCVCVCYSNKINWYECTEENLMASS